MLNSKVFRNRSLLTRPCCTAKYCSLQQRQVKYRAAAEGFSSLSESPQLHFKPHAWQSGRKLTWIKEDDGFKASVLIVIDLDVPQGLHQLIQDSGGHTSDFQFRAVHWNDEVIPWGDKRNLPSDFLSSSADTVLSRSYPKARCQRVPVPTCSRFPVCSFILRFTTEKQAVDLILWSLFISFAHVSAPTLYTKPAPRSALVYPLLYLASVCKWCCIFIFGVVFFKLSSPSLFFLMHGFQGQYSHFSKNNPTCVFGGRELHEKEIPMCTIIFKRPFC